MNIIAIDPSINEIGVCVYIPDPAPAGYRVLTVKTQAGLPGQKLKEIRRDLFTVVPETKTIALIEQPPAFTYNRSSKYSGKSLNQAAIQKLNWSFGVILELMTECCDMVELFLPNEYKGKMTVSLIQELVSHYPFVHKKLNEHESHAVYLCEWWRHRQKTGG